MMRATLKTIGQAATDLVPTLNDSLSTVLMRTHQLLRWPVSRGVSSDLRRLESKAYQCWATFLDAIRQGRQDNGLEETFEPESLVLSALDWVQLRARESQTRISVGIEAGLPRVTGDPVVLEQAFLLLLMGSVMAVEEDGGDLELMVDLVWKADAPTVRVTIRDERAAPPIRARQGLGGANQGMALVVAKEVIEAAGGTLDVAGGPFTGLEVTIHLPGDPPGENA
ncbi:MAG: sensor histidine kinase [Planctomycetota bacterium]|jgi:signal transduction histidine kinase